MIVSDELKRLIKEMIAAEMASCSSMWAVRLKRLEEKVQDLERRLEVALARQDNEQLQFVLE